MKKLNILLLLSTLGAVYSQAATTVKHTIKNGETLYTIAHKNHTSIEEVRKVNGLKKGDTLKIGRVITVPMNTYFPNKKKKIKKVAHVTKKNKVQKKTKVVKKTTRTKTGNYAIKSGDTLFTVARKHGMTVAELVNVNGIAYQSTLKLGQKLKVAKGTSISKKPVAKVKKVQTKTKAGIYAIKSGDTLFTIARKHGMTVSELVKANGIAYNSTLKLGQKVKVTKAATVKKKQKIASAKKKKKPVVKAKKVHKVKIVKNVKKKKKDRVLKTVLKKHAKPLASKRVKRKRTVTVDDIFFKASQPNVMFFNSKSNKKAKNIIRLAKTKLGRRYVWGATGTRGTFDCSGFTSYVFKKNGISIPRTSINQSKYGKYVTRANLKKGDLIFFDTSKRRKGYVNHVGIYLGNGKFIHASSAKKKVVVSNLSKFYAQRYKGARRPS